jgi:hypothetical protein
MTTYTILPYTVVWGDCRPQEDVEIDALTPKQQRAIGRKIMEMIDNEMLRVLSGGYDVQTNHAGSKGVTLEHVRRPRALLPDPRCGPRESGTGPDQPCASERETENPSEG